MAVLTRAIGIVACASVALAAGAIACSGVGSGEDGGAGEGGRDGAGDAGRDSRGDSATDVRAKDHAAEKGEASCNGDGGAPTLTELNVTGGSSIKLTPDFAPDIHDYYVQCAPGTNMLTVSMKASTGATTALTQPTSATGGSSLTKTLSVTENQAIVATASTASTCSQTAEYWVRCLPHDFPPMKWTEHTEAGAPKPGYYLLGGFNVPPKGTYAYAFVLDSHGVPVWYYAQPNGTAFVDVDSLKPGDITFDPFPFPHPFEIHQLDPYLVTKIPVGVPDQHDLQLLANGHYLLFISPPVYGVDLTGVDVPLPDGGTLKFGPNSVIQDCVMLEIDMGSTVDGGVAWEWRASDHFDPAGACSSPSLSQEIKQPDGGPIVDTIHCNAMHVDEPSGNILVSGRSMDSVFYVDKQSKRVLWKMGGKNSSKDPTTTFVPVDSPFQMQHDGRLVGWSESCAGGAGQISVFDDESLMTGPGAAARAALYDVSVVLGDGGTGADCGVAPPAGGTKATLAWSYAGMTTSSATGSFRILSDGSRTIGWGTTGTGRGFSEVDDAGNNLLEFDFADGKNGTYRAIKVPTTQLDLAAMRKTAGHP